MLSNGFEFDFVVSYASEDQEYAKSLFEALKSHGAKVFFAPEYQADIWGQNLFEYLAEIYSKKGKFCILLISENYVRKQWTRHEWRNAQERVLKNINTNYILPIRLDDSELAGFPSTIAYLHIKDNTIPEIAAYAIKKIRTELPYIGYGPDCTTDLFHKRISQAILGIRGLIEITISTQIKLLLDKVLQNPLSFEDLSDPLWWFEGTSSNSIRAYQYLENRTYLIDRAEMLVSKIWLYRNDLEPDLSFLYLECDPLLPIKLDQEAIDSQIKDFGHASEWLGYIPEKQQYISYAEYEDGYANIQGEVYKLPSSTQARVRRVSRYGVFITPKEGRINKTFLDGNHPYAGSSMSDLLKSVFMKKIEMNSFVEVLALCRPNRYRMKLIEEADF